MTEVETTSADLWATGITSGAHPVQHVRDQLAAAGILSDAQLRQAENGRQARVGGVVTHRQRSATASGVTFINLEDETGMANIIVRLNTFQAFGLSPEVPRH